MKKKRKHNSQKAGREGKKSDQHVISPYNTHTLSSKQAMRILKTCQVETVILIKHQILVTSLQGDV